MNETPFAEQEEYPDQFGTDRVNEDGPANERIWSLSINRERIRRDAAVEINNGAGGRTAVMWATTTLAVLDELDEALAHLGTFLNDSGNIPE